VFEYNMYVVKCLTSCRSNRGINLLNILIFNQQKQDLNYDHRKGRLRLVYMISGCNICNQVVKITLKLHLITLDQGCYAPLSEAISCFANTNLEITS